MIDALWTPRERADLHLLGAPLSLASESIELWRILVGPWLHLGGLHLLINSISALIMIRSVRHKTTTSMLLTVIVGGAYLGEALQFLIAGQAPVGGSGVVFALLGLWTFVGEGREKLPAHRRRLLWVSGFAIGFSLLSPSVNALVHTSGWVWGLATGWIWRKMDTLGSS